MHHTPQWAAYGAWRMRCVRAAPALSLQPEPRLQVSCMLSQRRLLNFCAQNQPQIWQLRVQYFRTCVTSVKANLGVFMLRTLSTGTYIG